MLATLQTGYRFGPFRIFPEQRQLVVDGKPVAIQGRAFDLLSFLVRNHGRVVSKVEIFAAVWAGTTVSDNNLTVQISVLRRTLIAHGGDPALIANVPGRGYQVLGQVEEVTTILGTGAEVSPNTLENSSIFRDAASLSPVKPNSRALRLTLPRRARSLLAIVAMVAVILFMLISGGSRMPDERLAIAVDNLSTGGSPEMAALASAYTDAIVLHPIFFGDVRLYGSGGCHPPVRYCLTGNVRKTSRETLLSVMLTQRANGLRVFGHDWPVPGAPSEEDLFVIGRTVLFELRSALFEAELRRQPECPCDAIDWYVRAQVKVAGDSDPPRVAQGIVLLEHALAIDPDHKPSRLLLASLLLTSLSLSPASAGDEVGRQVRDMLKPILIDEPDNAVALEDDALALLELNQPSDAIAAVRLAQRVSPADTSVWNLLSCAYIESGVFDQAADLLKRYPEIDDGSAAASLAFAQENYLAAILDVKRFQQVNHVDIHSNLLALLAAAAEWRLGRHSSARSMLYAALAVLPADFQQVSNLRQSYYLLPPTAWTDFRSALNEARSWP